MEMTIGRVGGQDEARLALLDEMIGHGAIIEHKPGRRLDHLARKNGAPLP